MLFQYRKQSVSPKVFSFYVDSFEQIKERTTGTTFNNSVCWTYSYIDVSENATL